MIQALLALAFAASESPSFKNFQSGPDGQWEFTSTVDSTFSKPEILKSTACIDSKKAKSMVETMNSKSRIMNNCKVKITADSATEASNEQVCLNGKTKTVITLTMKKPSDDILETIVVSKTGKTIVTTKTTSKFQGPCKNNPVATGNGKSECTQCSEEIKRLRSQCGNKLAKDPMCKDMLPQIEKACESVCK